MIFPAQLLGIFSQDPEFIRQGIQAVRMFSLGYCLVGIQMTVSVFFQGIGEGISSVFLASARQIIFLLPLIFILPRVFGYDGVWYAFPAADILATVVTIIWAAIRFKQIGIPIKWRYVEPQAVPEPVPGDSENNRNSGNRGNYSAGDRRNTYSYNNCHYRIHSDNFMERKSIDIRFEHGIHGNNHAYV